ncbi:zinc finger and BTB domain-containing protein 11-like [Gossypium australe]|uniref:Zinc finger and BTB domain-containing protein 11-like n=1 Tax=Gossypium australe TaxID=47621 RepID=A0A5B6W6U6_9ROSI|nr:zinc finger and BTB domain-containing protein 11-like [Gossypium australe]
MEKATRSSEYVVINDNYERVIQILDDMLRYYVLESKSNWEKYLLLVEFTWYCMKFYVVVNDKLCYIGRSSIGDRVFLKYFPRRGFFEVVAKRIYRESGPVIYRLELPSKLEQIHNVFQLSMLRTDHSYIISPTDVEI